MEVTSKMKKCVLFGLVFTLAMGLSSAMANTVVYVTNNNVNNNTVYVPSQSNMMCSERGGFCTNGHWIMSTRRTIYAPSRRKIRSAQAQTSNYNYPTY